MGCSISEEVRGALMPFLSHLIGRRLAEEKKLAIQNSKKTEITVICRICAKPVPSNIMKQHSSACKKNVELQSRMKDVNTKLKNNLFIFKRLRHDNETLLKIKR